MAIVFRRAEEEARLGFGAAGAQNALRDTLFERVFEAYSAFARQQDYGSVPVGALDSFADAVHAASPEGTRPFRDLCDLDGRRGPGDRGAVKYLCSMLEHVLRTNPAVEEEPGGIVEALGAECLFDGRHHSLFSTDCSLIVLDKDAARLDTFTRTRMEHVGTVMPWDILEEHREMAPDLSFEKFLTGRYGPLKPAYNRVRDAAMRSASFEFTPRPARKARGVSM